MTRHPVVAVPGPGRALKRRWLTVLASALVALSATSCAGGSTSAAQSTPRRTPEATLICLKRGGYAVQRVSPEKWLEPRPILKAFWAPLNRKVPPALLRTGFGAVTLLFYVTASQAKTAAQTWGEQARRALCAGFGSKERSCMERVHSRLRIPQFTRGNIFVNFNGLYLATPAEQHSVAEELGSCTAPFH